MYNSKFILHQVQKSHSCAEQAGHLPELRAQATAPGAALQGILGLLLFPPHWWMPSPQEKLTLGSSQIAKVPSLNSAMANEPSFYFFFTGHTSQNAEPPQPGMELMAPAVDAWVLTTRPPGRLTANEPS